MLAFLDGVQDLPAIQFKRAIVTLTVGDEYNDLWQTLCKKSWERYAGAFGYDIIVITQRLDQTERGFRQNPSWHKLLVYSQSWASKYERIVWVDADVIMSHSAMDIVFYVPDPAKVGICEGNAQFSQAELHIYKERLHKMHIYPTAVEKFARECSISNYLREGLVSDNPVEYNAGVFVASPVHHADFLRRVYEQYDEKCRLYEQVPLSHALTQAGLAQPLSSRFNWCLHPVVMLSHLNSMDFLTAEQIIAFLRNELDKAYFLHFAGCSEMMKVLLRWHALMKKHPLGDELAAA